MDRLSAPGLILTGTRGSGKSTLADRLLDGLGFAQPVGDTTRPPRPDDHGAYRYRTAEEFDALARAGDFVVSSRYAGNRYGVSRRELQEVVARGYRPLLTLTPQAAARVASEPGWVAIFVDAPDDVLDGRLRRRGGLSDGDRAQRQADRELRDRFLVLWNDGPLTAAVEAVHRALEGVHVSVQP